MVGNIRKSWRAFLECGRQVHARAAKCRGQAREDPRDKRHQEREHQDLDVRLDREIMNDPEPVAGSERSQ